MNKLKNLKDMVPVLRKLQKKGYKVVFTNGCFDILHSGHILYLRKAKSLGDILVVGLNSDKSVKKIKGPLRPLFPQKERAEILSSLRTVDYIAFFNEDTPIKIIKKVKPDILAKGGDYELDEIVGRDFLKSIGRRTVRIPFIKSKSTTNIIKKIIKS
ncbi:D-glycero-beta-D-manno-heptose 1-phosphate adenylyltransferase [bacterium]